MIKYLIGGKEFIDRIEPLWDKQRIHHSKISKHFSENFTSLTYSKRKQTFINYNENIFIVIARDDKKDIGYCVASIVEEKGKIDSIFVNSNYRGNKIGNALMNKALEWFDENHIEKIELTVAVGNEDVYDFYKQFGFYPKSTKLVRKT